MQLLLRIAQLRPVVGPFRDEFRSNLLKVPTRTSRFIGCSTGSLNDLIKLVSLAQRGIIKPLVCSCLKPKKSAQSLQILKDQKILGRGV
jgi:alcohol dehydrogenase, propanol-preferring